MKSTRIQYFKEKEMTIFDIKTFNLGNGNTLPSLLITWEDGSIKKLLFQDLDALESFIKEMNSNHIRAYGRLLEFSREKIAPKYPYVHRIITEVVSPSKFFV